MYLAIAKWSNLLSQVQSESVFDIKHPYTLFLEWIVNTCFCTLEDKYDFILSFNEKKNAWNVFVDSIYSKYLNKHITPNVEFGINKNLHIQPL